MATHTIPVEKTWSERQSFPWRIPHFVEMSQSAELLRKHRVTFEMGGGIDLPTKWECYLSHFTGDGKEQTERKDVGISVRLLDYPKDLKELHTYVRIQVRHKPGCYCANFFDSDFNRNMLDPAAQGKGYGFARVFKRGDLPLQSDGSVEIIVTLAIFNSSEMKVLSSTPITLELAKIITEYEAKFTNKFRDDLTNVRENPTVVLDRQAKFVSKDGKEFPINRVVLAARSPVFLRMFRSNMTEAEKGVVKVDDMDGEPLKLLLDFCHTGILSANWKDEGILEGLMYGANKYMLEDLVQFLEKVVALICTKENCGKLLMLARTLDMKEAEATLFQYFKKNVATNLDEVVSFVDTNVINQPKQEESEEDEQGKNKKRKIAKRK